MKVTRIFLVVIVSALTSIACIWGYGKFMESRYGNSQSPDKLPVNYAGFFDSNGNLGAPVDFTAAATTATPAVVHIKTKTKARKVTQTTPQQRDPWGGLFGDDDLFNNFFGGPRVIPEQRASGSGVLFNADGYIVTNNHVVENADEITVTLANKKTYKATVVGSDAASDIAVIKIEGKNFPYLVFGNSDDTKLGQWVLAIGYPLNLDVTVTAGIVSAKARNIGINRNKSNSPVESFIQTDAAVNQGNSGGALINTAGELIGINSAIASLTGSYAGYSYAIPVNMIKKITGDLMKFGAVQRGYIGIGYIPDDASDEDVRDYEKKNNVDIKLGEGIFVTDVTDEGAAKAAGIKKGDLVTKINSVDVSSGAELMAQIALYKPGDKINVAYKRDGKEYTTSLTLKNKAGNFGVVKADAPFDKLGGELADLDKATAKKYNVAGGVVVKKLGNSALKNNTRMQEGFVITSINGKSITGVEDLKKVLNNSSGQLRVEGFYPGYEGEYAYPLNLNNSSSDEDY